MMPMTSDPLVRAVEELRLIFPDMRFGQLVANLATSAGCAEISGLWDLEDEAMLIAAQRLIERNQSRLVVDV